MVTGDHPATAEAIARQAGIFSDETDEKSSTSCNRIIQGQDIHLLTDAEWEQVIIMVYFLSLSISYNVCRSSTCQVMLCLQEQHHKIN